MTKAALKGGQPQVFAKLLQKSLVRCGGTGFDPADCHDARHLEIRGLKRKPPESQRSRGLQAEDGVFGFTTSFTPGPGATGSPA